MHTHVPLLRASMASRAQRRSMWLEKALCRIFKTIIKTIDFPFQEGSRSVIQIRGKYVHHSCVYIFYLGYAFCFYYVYISKEQINIVFSYFSNSVCTHSDCIQWIANREKLSFIYRWSIIDRDWFVSFDSSTCKLSQNECEGGYLCFAPKAVPEAI